MDPLHQAVVVIVRAALLAFLGMAFLQLPALIAALRGVDRRVLFVLALLIGADLAILKPLLPHNIWHEQHAVSLVVQVETGRAEGGFDVLHGPVYSTLMKALYRLSGGRLSIFSINHGIACVSVLLLFCLAWLATAEAGLALAAAALLLLLPTHLRLSATEDMHILVEFFSTASLVFFLLYARTRRVLAFAAGELCLFLLMHLRSEMMLLAPVFGTALFVSAGRDLRRQITREPRLWAAGLPALALCLPRVFEILRMGDPRIHQFLPPERVGTYFSRLGPAGLNTFFDPEFTPVLYVVLFAAGLLGLLIRHRREFLFLNVYWLVATYFYSTHLSCLSLRVRTAMASQFILVLIAAFGFHWLVRTLAPGRRTAASALLTLSLLFVPFRYRDFLRTLYTRQEEYLFLRDIAQRIPSGAGVFYLSQEDDAELIQDRRYPQELMDAVAYVARKEIAFSGLRPALRRDHRPHSNPSPLFYYKGIACYTLPYTTSMRKPPPEAHDPGFVNPLCRQVEERFRLVPVAERRVGNRSQGWDGIEGDQRTIGLYRVSQRGSEEAWRS